MRPFDEDAIEREIRDLNDSSVSDAKKLLYCLKRVDESRGENPHPALIKPLGSGLFEVRHHATKYGGRAIFCYVDELDDLRETVLLHVFRKESQKTPARSLEVARARFKLIRREK